MPESFEESLPKYHYLSQATKNQGSSKSISMAEERSVTSLLSQNSLAFFIFGKSLPSFTYYG